MRLANICHEYINAVSLRGGVEVLWRLLAPDTWLCPLLSPTVFLMPCVSLTLAAKFAPGFFYLFFFIHVTQRCVQCEWSGGEGEIWRVPFGSHWPSALQAGTVSQVRRPLLALTALTLTQKRLARGPFLFKECVCVSLCVRARAAWANQASGAEVKCNEVRFCSLKVRTIFFLLLFPRKPREQGASVGLTL